MHTLQSLSDHFHDIYGPTEIGELPTQIPKSNGLNSREVGKGGEDYIRNRAREVTWEISVDVAKNNVVK